MKLVKIFAVSLLTSVFALSTIAQESEETDATTSSSESLTKLDKAQAATDENEVSDASSEMIDGLVESMMDVALSMFGFTLSENLFDEAIADLETSWPASIEKFDTDKDGSLSLEELENVPEEEWEDDFKALSAEERKETLKNQFNELDADEDGEVTTEEVVKHVEQQVKVFNELIEGLELTPSTESDVDERDADE